MVSERSNNRMQVYYRKMHRFTFLPRVSSANRYQSPWLSICSSVTLSYNFNTNRPTIMLFSPYSSPKTLVLGDVKMLQRYHYHPTLHTIYIHTPKSKYQSFEVKTVYGTMCMSRAIDRSALSVVGRSFVGIIIYRSRCAINRHKCFTTSDTERTSLIMIVLTCL